MSIADKIVRLTAARDAQAAALAAKGVDVPDGAGFEDFPALTESIETGGGELDALINGSITEISSAATEIRQYACYNFSALTSVSFPCATTVQAHAFYGCTGLTITNDSFPSVISFGTTALHGCCADSLTFAGIEASGNGSFSGFKAKEIRLPNLTSVNVRTFRYCTALEGVYVPKLTNLYGEDFQGCTALTHICLPSVTYFHQGTSCFSGCTALVALILPGATVPTLAAAMTLPDDAVLYVPAALLEEYKAATNWTALQDKMASIEDSADVLQWLADNGYDYGGTV